MLVGDLQVHFDGQASQEGGNLLLATQDGCLVSTAAEGGSPLTPLVKDVHNSIPSFACDPVRSGHLFCLAGWECLMYAHRT